VKPAQLKTPERNMKKVVLVTGAAGNLGQTTVDLFLKEGYTVIGTVSPGKKLTSNIANLFYEEIDLRNEANTNKLVSKIANDHGRLDVAVLTVGGFAMGSIENAIENADGESLKRMMSLNFETAYYSARAAFLQMKNNGFGRIIFIGSRPALEPDRGKHVVTYALSKSTLLNLAEILNEDGRKKNIKCHIVAPGTIDTPENRSAMPDANFSEWIKPEKLAGMIFQLATTDGSQTVIKAY
jgi:NAD(P)-dependent dehydrogenase (short-subunit alcohol dehydrogenase family)